MNNKYKRFYNMQSSCKQYISTVLLNMQITILNWIL